MQQSGQDSIIRKIFREELEGLEERFDKKLDEKLANFATKQELDEKLANFATKQDLDKLKRELDENARKYRDEIMNGYSGVA